MLKVGRAAFAVACFWGLSDVHECPGHLQMAACPGLDEQTTGCNSPHYWLMSLAIDLTTLCDMWRWKWHQWMHLAGFSEDITFAHHFVVTHPPPPSYPVGVLLVFAIPVKKLSKTTGNSASYSPYSWWIDRL